MYIIRMINKDTSSHSWKSMLSYLHSYGQMYHPLCASRFNLFPLHKFHVECLLTSVKKFVLALHLGDNVEDTVSSNCKVAAWFSTRQIIQSIYRTIQTCSETLPEASVFTTLTFPKLNTIVTLYIFLNISSPKGYKKKNKERQ